MRRALSEYIVTGIRTNLAFHEKLFQHPEFVAGRYDTGFIERATRTSSSATRSSPRPISRPLPSPSPSPPRGVERATGANTAQQGESGSRLAVGRNAPRPPASLGFPHGSASRTMELDESSSRGDEPLRPARFYFACGCKKAPPPSSTPDASASGEAPVGSLFPATRRRERGAVQTAEARRRGSARNIVDAARAASARL